MGKARSLMKLYMKVGTLPGKMYLTKNRESLKVGDIIDVQSESDSRRYHVKIDKIIDDIPVIYFSSQI